MLTVVGNVNNPATLKLFVASNFKPKEFTNIVDPGQRNLPYVNVTEEERVYSANAALWYIMPAPEDRTDSVRELLELEAVCLAHPLAVLLGNNVKSEKLQNTVSATLQRLNGLLAGKSFLVGDGLTAADVAVFSTLYPLYKSPKHLKTFVGENDNLSKWFVTLENMPEFQTSISQLFAQAENIVPVAYQTLFNTSKYIVPQAQETEKVLNRVESQVDGQKNDMETVTPAELQAAEQAWKKGISGLPKLKTPDKIVLPKAGEKNVLITSALPYVNNVPHLGNIIGCVLSADVFARYSRLCNNNTLYIAGTDEYGTATETKALEEGLTCRQICDKYYEIHNEIYKWFNISFDYFGRTSAPMQTELAQDLFLQLNENGFMFTQSVEQLHCEKCDRYLADRFVEGGCPNIGCNYEDARGDQCDGCGKLVNAIELKNPRCKICGDTPKVKSSSQYFIDLPKLQDSLNDWVHNSSSNWSHNAYVIAKAWLNEGLKPRCITRDLKWGVPVPLDGFRNKVFYVWFDAPIGYMSISKAYTKEYEKWWRPEKDVKVDFYQFMAKDNVPFHAILFPAILMGAKRNYVTVSHIMATEYLNYEDGKFSKSRGIGVFGNDAKDTIIPNDVWRFYLLYIRPEAQDSSFSWNDLATKNNSELLNNLGNFINRALTFVKNNFDREVPKMELVSEDYALLALCTRELKGYNAALEKCRLRDGIRHILSISRFGNQYMQSNQPWVKVKEGDQGRLRAGTVVGLCANLCSLLSTLLKPYMPIISGQLQSQLNCTDFVLGSNNMEIVNLLPTGHKIGDPKPLFTKIESSVIEEYKKRFAGTQESRKSPPKKTTGTGDIDDKDLEEAIAKQGAVVTKLKEKGVDPLVWQAQLAKLSLLTQQLASFASGNNAKQNSVNHVAEVPKNNVDIQLLESKIAEQGSLVRKLKEGQAPKPVWEPEVKKLLLLKQQMADATGVPVAKNQKGQKSKKK